MTRGELIARLEAAGEGSRELDYAIWSNLQGVTMTVLKIGGGFETTAYDGELLDPNWLGAPRLTTSLDAIVALIERKLSGARWEVTTTGFKPGSSIVDARGVWQAGSYAETAPLALCIALLRARECKAR